MASSGLCGLAFSNQRHFRVLFELINGVNLDALSTCSSCRLGFVVDFLSHAVVTGFTSGAAITIALQQLKGLLGYTKFTNSTDIVSVLSFVFDNTSLFNWRAFLIGISFLVYLLVLRTVVC